MGENYYIVRSEKAGVFFGKLKSKDGEAVTMTHCRKLWYWDGATETLQLATDGVSKPGQCKFTVFVDEILIYGVCELIPCTEKAVESLLGVPVWTA